MIEVTLPWPPKELSPNARLHWSKLARAKKAYRYACAMQAKQQGVALARTDRLNVHFTFYPPTKRRIDMDNCIARMKSGIDGLADVLGVDDSRWLMGFEMAETVGGMVKIKIVEIENA